MQRHLRSQGRDDLAGMLDALGEPMRSRAAVEIQAMDSEFAERIRHEAAREELNQLVWERLEANPHLAEK